MDHGPLQVGEASKPTQPTPTYTTHTHLPNQPTHPSSYALYAYYGYDQGYIAMLYVGGYLSSMLAGSFVGSLADKYGRKKMAVMYAVFYIVSCFIKLVRNTYCGFPCAPFFLTHPPTLPT